MSHTWAGIINKILDHFLDLSPEKFKFWNSESSASISDNSSFVTLIFNKTTQSPLSDASAFKTDHFP